jgi:hypothetical protein
MLTQSDHNHDRNCWQNLVFAQFRGNLTISCDGALGGMCKADSKPKACHAMRSQSCKQGYVLYFVPATCPSSAKSEIFRTLMMVHHIIIICWGIT